MTKNDLLAKVQADLKRSKAANLVCIFLVNRKAKNAAGHEIDDWTKLSFPASDMTDPSTVQGEFENKAYEQLFKQGYLKVADFNHPYNEGWCVLAHNPFAVVETVAEPVAPEAPAAPVADTPAAPPRRKAEKVDAARQIEIEPENDTF